MYNHENEKDNRIEDADENDIENENENDTMRRMNEGRATAV